MSDVAPIFTPPNGKESLSDAHEAQTDLVSVNTASHGIVQYTRSEERKLVRKIDFVVVPILLVLYLLSFLDRSNIGNAKLDGLVKDIKLNDYSTALTLFFVGYVIGEVPANIVLKKTSPPVWLPTLTLIWGIISVVQGLVHNQAGLFAVRFFLGLSESGLFPGSVFVFSMFYPRRERHYRVALLLSGAAFSGAFGGILAYAIGFMRGVGGKNGWSWILILEGLLTIVVAISAYWLVPHYPLKSRSFTEREKSVIVARMQADRDSLDEESFSWDGVKQAFTDPYVYLYGLLFHGFAFALYTISLFMPTIIADLGYTAAKAQLLTVPPYFLAFVFTMTIAHISFVVNRRLIFIIGSALLAILGYIVQITSPTVAGRYVAIFITTPGVYAGNALLLSLPSENVSGQTKRATALAMQIGFGNIGSIIGVQLYRRPLGGLKNASYHISHGLSIVWLAFGVGAATALWILLSRENNRRDAVQASGNFKGGNFKDSHDTEEEQKRLGDRRLDWRYHI
ncbi:related to TNA1 - High affinity nicotinic acid plasma membrane permease [Melanopsichium pennsylvanicum]|uniref:Related to TNA1 - High affinity nicotinic acid plasma membrane permease n=2 Tax=Melanopsichium pennsylvanicum TaxID=63383 RepID=A0AAJ4XG08_9BASI|nr:related to TNA1-High affinity nicotinic acid plasma membrane permease [Melanopsichium pennsylvanicum 4]SNX81325.1 related to TNA1 - High affinity nicotinic acid plasma membrane permease [Melanopsichium pennsylvanicum]